MAPTTRARPCCSCCSAAWAAYRLVISAPTMKMTPEAKLATTSGSATTMTGGVSMMIVSKFSFSESSSSLKRFELLSSKRFKELLDSLKENFDTIIIDTPPVMVVADPLVVASFASGVIFIVGAEMTSRYAAQAALQQLQQGRARVVGAILNRVQLDKNGYYYSRYYKREYGAYYC